MSNATYRLIRSPDERWHVIPSDRWRAAEAYFDRLRELEMNGDDSEPPEEPEGLFYVGKSLSDLEFTGFSVGGRKP